VERSETPGTRHQKYPKPAERPTVESSRYRLNGSLYRPLRDFVRLVGPWSRGCASLHPGLYAVGRSADLIIFVVEVLLNSPSRYSRFTIYRLLRAPSRQLLNPNHNEFGGLERRETYDDVDYSRVDVILSGGCFVAPDKESLARFRPLKRSLTKQTSHEGAKARTNLCPKQIIVRLEDRPLRTLIKTLFEINRQAPYRNVFPLTRLLIERARAPGDISDLRKSS